MFTGNMFLSSSCVLKVVICFCLIVIFSSSSHFICVFQSVKDFIVVIVGFLDSFVFLLLWHTGTMHICTMYAWLHYIYVRNYSLRTFRTELCVMLKAFLSIRNEKPTTTSKMNNTVRSWLQIRF